MGEKIPITLASSEMNDVLNEVFIESESEPSDIIKLTPESCTVMKKLCIEQGMETENGIIIPSDLFFAKTVPLMDCVIEILSKGDTKQDSYKARVAVVPNYKDLIDEVFKLKENNDAPMLVGAIIPEFEVIGQVFIIPIFVSYGVDTIQMSSSPGYVKTTNAYIIKEFPNHLDIGMLTDYCVEMISIWYGIQISLLHPMVKEVVNQGKRVKERIPKEKRKGKSNKRVTRYVKYHVLDNPETITEALHTPVETKTEKGEYVRRCMAWYVIGHWRNCKSGKKTFVRPYWKGQLRELKKNMDDIRERIIDMKKEDD